MLSIVLCTLEKVTTSLCAQEHKIELKKNNLGLCMYLKLVETAIFPNCHLTLFSLTSSINYTESYYYAKSALLTLVECEFSGAGCDAAVQKQLL